MRLLLLADGEVGSSICNFLMTHYPQDVVLVVVMRPGPLTDMAHSVNVPYLQFTSEEELIAQLPEGIDLGVLAWWPKILKKDLLRIPRNGFINTHPSLLPWNRGKHYNFWALVEEAPFGVTIHKVDLSIDHGHIFAQEAIIYDWTDTGETLYRKAQEAMILLFKKVWPALRGGQITLVPQPKKIGSFHLASELDEASRIHLDRPYLGRELLNLLRARTFPSHPGCWFEADGQRYEIAINIKKIEK